eukprot:GFYU01002282.1.p1 GENE.GFYU01002282.1~~GFYU01002282.1.p1  ORF type:complete len:190 (-),score=32.57 GFYU01002282.1:70-639(-)
MDPELTEVISRWFKKRKAQVLTCACLFSVTNLILFMVPLFNDYLPVIVEQNGDFANAQTCWVEFTELHTKVAKDMVETLGTQPTYKEIQIVVNYLTQEGGRYQNSACASVDSGRYTSTAFCAPCDTNYQCLEWYHVRSTCTDCTSSTDGDLPHNCIQLCLTQTPGRHTALRIHIHRPTVTLTPVTRSLF